MSTSALMERTNHCETLTNHARLCGLGVRRPFHYADADCSAYCQTHCAEWLTSVLSAMPSYCLVLNRARGGAYQIDLDRIRVLYRDARPDVTLMQDYTYDIRRQEWTMFDYAALHEPHPHASQFEQRVTLPQVIQNICREMSSGKPSEYRQHLHMVLQLAQSSPVRHRRIGVRFPEQADERFWARRWIQTGNRRIESALVV